MLKWWWFCILIAYYGQVLAQVSLPNQLHALPITEKIMLDGNLNETVWQQAAKISNFTQRELVFGQSATEKTEVAIAFNQQYLYIAVWCYDSFPDKIIAKELRRDFNYEIDDNFMVIIDTYNDDRNGFMFVTNPNASRADLQVFNNGGSTNSFWNGVWNVKTTRTSQGWFAEFEIPFYTFKYKDDLPNQEWGINFERNIRHKREQVLWQGWSRNNKIQQVNQAGTLVGLSGLTSNNFLEFKPYGLAGYQKSAQERGIANAGADLNYQISPSYRLNVTANTDFAQVEVDQQQVNITRFPLFFPELREFFLEGDDYFNFGFGGNRIFPFYTRKIGLTANRTPIRILGGARLLGKSQKTTLGVMSLQTEADGVQPTTNYSTLSWRQDIGKQSVIGAMSTNTFIKNRWHTTTGANFRYSTPKLFGSKNLDVTGAFIQTFNTDSGFQAKAFAYRFFVLYPNDKFFLIASTQRAPVSFNPEVGLMLRQNFTEYFAEGQFKPRPKKHLTFIRQFEFIPVSYTHVLYDDTKQIQSLEYKVQYLGFETKSGERFTIDYRFITEGLNKDFNIAKDIVIKQGEYKWKQSVAEFKSFKGRVISATARIGFGEFYNGNSVQLRTEVLWRTDKYLNFNLRYEKNKVNLPEGDFTTELYGGRIEYAINPNIFGSLLGQWNNTENQFSFNYRLQIIPKIGTDFYLIVNRVYYTESGQNKLDQTTILAKLIWRFTL